jgi:hypothetical protein
MHAFENAPVAISAPRRIVARIEVVPVWPMDFMAVFELVADFAPSKDLADGCLVVPQRRIPNSFVVTTDHRDFATYRTPSLSSQSILAR